MAAPTWVAGQVLAAADVNSWFVPLAAVKTADQSITSSTTLVNDTALFLPVAANATYLLKGFLLYTGAGTGNIQWGWTFPGTLSVQYQFVNLTTAAAIQTITANQGTIGTGGTTSVTVPNSTMMLGTAVNGATAGTLQLQWAQVTSSASSTIMKAQSALTLWRIS